MTAYRRRGPTFEHASCAHQQRRSGVRDRCCVVGIRHDITTQYRNHDRSLPGHCELGYTPAPLRVFGSAGRDAMTDDSDVDILIEFDRPIGAFEFLDLQDDLARMRDRPQDPKLDAIDDRIAALGGGAG